MKTMWSRLLIIAGSAVFTAVNAQILTPPVPLELPVEVETELAPAGSLKQAPLWHEIAEVLEHPDLIDCSGSVDGTECIAYTERREGFGVDMPPLNVWNPCFNVLTGQPLRWREDGEISWDQPGLLFGPDDGDATTPLTEVIGNIVVDANNNLVVSNPVGNSHIPPDGTVVAVPACNSAGETIDPETGLEVEFELPISELDFLRAGTDTVGVAPALVGYLGRRGAQVLGKALFWDMQVGSDGIQACASCHFHAGVDNRTRNQLNPNHLGGDVILNLHGGVANQNLTAADFPFHKLVDPEIPGEPLLNPGNVASDTNDVASSMGVRFRQFVNIRPIGALSFGFIQSSGVRALLPDLGNAVADPIPLFQGLRRVEPRNTPTIFATAFNFDNFWDGRARHDANGGSVFGPADPQFHVFIDEDGGLLDGASNGDFRPDLVVEDPEVAEQPVRIRFSSLASLATGPALSDFEMSFAGRNWPKLAKKLLQGDVPGVRPQSPGSQNSVVPLANQLVATTDSVLGPFSNQGGTVCAALSRPTAANRPGLCISYGDLTRLAFIRELWRNTGQRLIGAPAVCSTSTSALNGVVTPAGCDPFDGYVLSIAGGPATAGNTNQFRQIEANFSLFFGLSLQIWQQLLIPDHTPFDQFMDANPLAANAVAQPGEQGTLPPHLVRGLVLPGGGELTLVEGFGADEIFGFDIFSGANLTAALPLGARNPTGVGSNPFLRSARCMLCHLGPEQTDHTNNVNAGLLHSGTEFELPPPGAPEPTGVFRLVTGASLAEEVEENAQDGVEVENRNFSIVPGAVAQYNLLSVFPGAVPQDVGAFADQIGLPSAIAFQDNGVYNIGVRPTREDIMRGGRDAFGWPLSLAAMAMKNLGGFEYEPSDGGNAGVIVALVDACGDASSACAAGSGLYEPTGADQRVNPGLQMTPAQPRLPEYLAPWANNLPAGELHPAIDELAFAPNTVTHPPFAEFEEILFGSDTNCALFDTVQFGNVAPNFGWGPKCPNSQSAISNNITPTMNGTWPFANRVARNGAVKAPQLRNIELTGPYFHTGSYLTLRQVVDFYMRGGDFPITNAEDRDPNLVDIGRQVFGFGSTNAVSPPLVLDGIPDIITRYDAMPDTDAVTPEPATQTAEDASVALVKFLLAMTDDRVRFERAPFDHPEIFVPLNGTAPDNVFGTRNIVLLQSLPALGPNRPFRRVPAVGAAGAAAPLPGFLDVSRVLVPGSNNDHFDR